MPKISQRIPNLPEDQWTPDVREIFPMMVPPGSPMKGSDFNSILMMVHHPELSKSWLTYNKELSAGWVLPARLKELAILRVAWVLQAEYEWVQHMLIAARLGFDAALYRSVQQGADDPVWSDLERHVLRAADQGCKLSPMDEGTWNGLSEHLDAKQMLELMFAIGSYVMLAWIFHSTGLELEEPFGVQARALDFPMIEE